jgi:hypothetical protein
MSCRLRGDRAIKDMRVATLDQVRSFDADSGSVQSHVYGGAARPPIGDRRLDGRPTVRRL